MSVDYDDLLYWIRHKFEKAENFQERVPFNHIVVDNFLSEGIASELLSVIPSTQRKAESMGKTARTKVHGYKKYTINPSLLDAEKRQLFDFFNSSQFLDMLESITGIKGLIGDAHFEGGGIHITFNEGSLNIHTDFSHNKRMRARRRLNLIIYMNPEWNVGWGGSLILTDFQRDDVKIAPAYNRAVLFETNADSFHGHPEPLNMPADIGRKSIAFYYYDVPEEKQRNETAYKVSQYNPFFDKFRIIWIEKWRHLKNLRKFFKIR